MRKSIKLSLFISLIVSGVIAHAKTIKIVGELPTWQMLNKSNNQNKDIKEILDQQSKYNEAKKTKINKLSSSAASSTSAYYLIIGGGDGFVPAGAMLSFAVSMACGDASKYNYDYTDHFDAIECGENVISSKDTREVKKNVDLRIEKIELSLLEPLNNELTSADPAFVESYGVINAIEIDRDEGFLKKISLESGYVLERKENGKTVWFEGKNVMNENLEVLQVYFSRSMK